MFRIARKTVRLQRKTKAELEHQCVLCYAYSRQLNSCIEFTSTNIAENTRHEIVDGEILANIKQIYSTDFSKILCKAGKLTTIKKM